MQNSNGLLQFPIGEYKGKSAGGGNTEVQTFPYRGMQRQIRRRRIIFEILIFPYRGTQRDTAGGEELLTFKHSPIRKWKGKPPEADWIWNFDIFPQDCTKDNRRMRFF